MLKKTIISASLLMTLTTNNAVADELATLTDLKVSLYYLINNYNDVKEDIATNKNNIINVDNKMQQSNKQRGVLDKNITYNIQSIEDRLSKLEMEQKRLPKEVVVKHQSQYDKQIKAFIKKQSLERGSEQNSIGYEDLKDVLLEKTERK